MEAIGVLMGRALCGCITNVEPASGRVVEGVVRALKVRKDLSVSELTDTRSFWPRRVGANAIAIAGCTIDGPAMEAALLRLDPSPRVEGNVIRLWPGVPLRAYDEACAAWRHAQTCESWKAVCSAHAACWEEVARVDAWAEAARLEMERDVEAARGDEWALGQSRARELLTWFAGTHQGSWYILEHEIGREPPRCPNDPCPGTGACPVPDPGRW